jgi:FkbM family methyltransferase
MNILQKFCLLCQFPGTLRVLDAAKYIASKYCSGTYRVRPNLLPCAVALRGRTSDPPTLKKIFVRQEYDCPFALNDVRFIIDAGANIGLSALYFAAQYPKATIIAIEPEPDNFSMLKRNCDHLPNIIPLHGALWPVSGDVALTDSMNGSACAFTVGRDDRKKIGTVRGYSMPEIMSAYKAAHIDLLKLDIEGSEKELFSGNTEWLDCVSVIAIELHDRYKEGCSSAFYKKLCELNFAQEIRGENIFIRLSPSIELPSSISSKSMNFMANEVH